MSDVELFDEAVEHHVAPAMPSFFDQFWREAERRQRIAARRWRAAALVCAVVALAAVAAAGVMASARFPASSIEDQTWSCAVPRGAGYQVQWRTSVTTPSTNAYFFFTPQPQAATQVLGPAALRLDTHPGKVTWDAARCTRSHVAVPLTAKGLSPEIVVTTHFVGSTMSTCQSAARILLHARVTVSKGEPVRAKIAVVTAATRRPVGYVDWTPTRIATWTSKCESF